jgi:thiol-disulfide isomerase/thioredoxin
MHGMLHEWHFLTGSLPQLRRVWHAYHIAVQVEHGQIDHTPALFVIDPDGRMVKVYLTQMSYSSVEQQGQLMAQEASSLLPGHPAVRSRLSYDQIPSIAPATAVALPRVGGPTLRLGPGGPPRLLLFFATWDSEVGDLAAQLERLGGYESMAARERLPALAAIDEGSVEPSPGALPHFLDALRTALPYPVAVDSSGRVADGYGVQDEPWLTLISPAGRILWYYDVSTAGWMSTRALARQVRTALANPKTPQSAAAHASLTGSPAALRALHRQAGELLGAQAMLSARLSALRGYPVVLNAWASWCPPCRSEFGLFASASASYGRQVAFLGADADDSTSDARSFLAQHPVSYPSYQTSTTALSSLGAIEGLPTTIFIDRTGKVVYVHIGQYVSQGTLDADIESHALAR